VTVTARVLGVAVGTVKSTNARALEKLRRSPELTDSAGTKVEGLI
jgi:DNA-directed RNA polymerase specialized sigma24 family protein